MQPNAGRADFATSEILVQSIFFALGSLGCKVAANHEQGDEPQPDRPDPGAAAVDAGRRPNPWLLVASLNPLPSYEQSRTTTGRPTPLLHHQRDTQSARKARALVRQYRADLRGHFSLVCLLAGRGQCPQRGRHAFARGGLGAVEPGAGRVGVSFPVLPGSGDVGHEDRAAAVYCGHLDLWRAGRFFHAGVPDGGAAIRLGWRQCLFFLAWRWRRLSRCRHRSSWWCGVCWPVSSD